MSENIWNDEDCTVEEEYNPPLQATSPNASLRFVNNLAENKGQVKESDRRPMRTVRQDPLQLRGLLEIELAEEKFNLEESSTPKAQHPSIEIVTTKRV